MPGTFKSHKLCRAELNPACDSTVRHRRNLSGQIHERGHGLLKVVELFPGGFQINCHFFAKHYERTLDWLGYVYRLAGNSLAVLFIPPLVTSSVLGIHYLVKAGEVPPLK